MVTISALATGCLVVLVSLGASPAAAQSTFGTLPSKVKLGQQVIVYNENGTVTKGKVEAVSESSLTIADAKRSHSFVPADVRRVRKPGPIWDGALVGALSALLPTVLICAGMDDSTGCGELALAVTAIGGGIGLGIDAAIPPRTLYRRPAGGSKVTLVPIVGPDRRGFAASFRF